MNKPNELDYFPKIFHYVPKRDERKCKICGREKDILDSGLCTYCSAEAGRDLDERSKLINKIMSLK